MVKKLINKEDLEVPANILKYIAKVINLMHQDHFYKYLDDNQCWIKIILCGLEVYESLLRDEKRKEEIKKYEE